MATDWTAEHIQRRMSQIRHELDETVDDISDQARRLQDWRYYVRQYPWLLLGTAAALGYMIVPARPKVFEFDPEQLAALGRQEKKVVVEARPGIGNFLVRTALRHLSGALMGSAAKYLGQRLGALSERTALSDAAVGTESRSEP